MLGESLRSWHYIQGQAVGLGVLTIRKEFWVEEIHSDCGQGQNLDFKST